MIDKHIPDNLYYSAQTEWSDGSKSDVIYVLKNKVTDTLPPTLIEIQNWVDQNFLSRLIRYCTYVYGRYKVLPVVFVVVVKWFSSIAFETEFVTDNSAYLFETEYKHWAKKCYFISAKSIKEHVKQTPMNQLVALGYFMTKQSRCSLSLDYSSDPTVRLLYFLAREIVLKEGIAENETINSIQQILEKIIDNSEITTETVNSCAKEGLNLLDKRRREYGNNAFETETTQKDSKIQKMNASQDFSFVKKI